MRAHRFVSASAFFSLFVAGCFNPYIDDDVTGRDTDASSATDGEASTTSASGSTTASTASSESMTTDPSATTTMTTADTTAADASATMTTDSTDDSSGGGSCDEEPAEIAGVTLSSSDMGECCGGSFDAMLDGSGLSGGALNLLDAVHNCTDADGWKSNGTQAGYVEFDLGQSYLVSSLYVWNSGQVGGDRGVDGVLVQTSTDGVNFEDLPGGPASFAKAESCPVAVEAFDFAEPTIASSIRIHVLSTHNTGGVTNAGLGEVAFLGVPCN